MLWRFLCAGMVICLAGSAAAGPFGIDMGTPRAGLDSAETDHKIELRSVPTPHPLFESYSAWWTESLGVCRVLAISRPYERDAYGAEVRNDFARVAEAVAAKYGEGDVLETLRHNALWDEPRDWVMSILQNERIHARNWEEVSAGDESYSVIQLWIDAFSSSSSIMILEYRAPFFDDCLAEIDGAVDDAF